MSTASRTRPMLSNDPADRGGRGLGWAIYAAIVLVGFVFGVVVGNMRPKTVEVVKNLPGDTKPEVKKEPEKKVEPEKKEPEKKDPPIVKMPDPTSEPKPPEPKPEPNPEPKTSPEPKVKEVLFAKEVLPIFVSKCVNCHGAIGKPKGALDLRTLASIAKGGENGVALKPGDLKSSLIWASIEDEVMPPPDKTQLTAAEKTTIKNWILSGGK